MVGTTLFTGDDHALNHRNLGSAVNAIETTLGTTAGTSVIKNFAAGDFAARINSSNVLQQSLTGTLGMSAGSITGQISNTGTVANGVYGTAQITGGTATSQTLGSPTLSSEGIMKQISTPGTPTSGYDKLYFKSDDNLYKLTSGNTETKVNILLLGTQVTSAGGTTSSASLIPVPNGTLTVPVASTGTVLITANAVWQISTTPSHAQFQLFRGTVALGSLFSLDESGATNNNLLSITILDLAVAIGTYNYNLQFDTNAGIVTANSLVMNALVYQ